MSWMDLGVAGINALGKIGGASGQAAQQGGPVSSGGLFDSSGWTVTTGGAGVPGDVSKYVPWALAALVLVVLLKGRRK